MRKLLIFLVLLAYTTAPLHAQEVTVDDAIVQDSELADSEDDASAYYGSARAAHWSAYVPIGVLIVAAIFMGFADKDHSHPNKNDSFYHGCTLGTPPSLSSELGG